MDISVEINDDVGARSRPVHAQALGRKGGRRAEAEPWWI